jgi:hypothetical protein
MLCKTGKMPRYGIRAVARDVRPTGADGHTRHVSPLAPLATVAGRWLGYCCQVPQVKPKTFGEEILIEPVYECTTMQWEC